MRYDADTTHACVHEILYSSASLKQQESKENLRMVDIIRAADERMEASLVTSRWQ